MTNSIYNSIINKIDSYAAKRHITVTLSNRFAYDAHDQEVFLNAKCKNKIKYIIYYLHELGHAVQQDSYFHKLKYKTNNIKKSIILEQEYTAWVNGYHIAHALDIIDVLNKEYLIEWVSAWRTYFEFIHKFTSKQLHNMFTGYIAENRPPSLRPLI